MKYAFGVDIGGTTVKMGLFQGEQLLDTWEIPTRTESGGENILPDIAVSIKSMISKKSLNAEDIQGIGMGVPGPVLDDGTVNKCVNLGWGVFNVTKKTTELTGLSCRAGNDANVAALGEMWQGGGRGFSSMVMVTLGTGVGAGVIVGGKMISGFFGAGGEIGHIPVVEPDEAYGVCGCGKRGCLEQYTSASGVAKVGKLYLEKNPDIETSLRKYGDLTSKDIFDEAQSGDCAALYLVDQYGKTLAKALATVSCVVDPEGYVLGGGLSKAGTILIDAITKYYSGYAFHACRDVKFSLASLGNSAGIYGGAYLIYN